MKREHYLQFVWGSFPLTTNTLSGAGYKSELMEMCMFLIVKTLWGAGNLSDWLVQIFFLNTSESLWEFISLISCLGMYDNRNKLQRVWSFKIFFIKGLSSIMSSLNVKSRTNCLGYVKKSWCHEWCCNISFWLSLNEVRDYFLGSTSLSEDGVLTLWIKIRRFWSCLQ